MLTFSFLLIWVRIWSFFQFLLLVCIFISLSPLMWFETWPSENRVSLLPILLIFLHYCAVVFISKVMMCRFNRLSSLLEFLGNVEELELEGKYECLNASCISCILCFRNMCIFLKSDRSWTHLSNLSMIADVPHVKLYIECRV